MALLLISRGSFSGGQLISQCFSKTTGMRCITREDLIASVNRHGELATRVTQSMAKAAHDYGKFSALRRPYKVLMQLALLEYVRHEDIAYLGYSGHLLLTGIPHAVRVRIIAPSQLRVKLMMGRLKITAEEAQEQIRQVDEERSRWTRFMYGKNLRDPELFDLCINLERISLPTACCMLVHIVQQNEFKVTPESQQMVEDRYLSVRVLAALLENPQTFELELGATAQNGRVLIEGPFLDEPVRTSLLETVRAVPGVEEIQYKEGYASPFEEAG